MHSLCWSVPGVESCIVAHYNYNPLSCNNSCNSLGAVKAQVKAQVSRVAESSAHCLRKSLFPARTETVTRLQIKTKEVRGAAKKADRAPPFWYPTVPRQPLGVHPYTFVNGQVATLISQNKEKKISRYKMVCCTARDHGLQAGASLPGTPDNCIFRKLGPSGKQHSNAASQRFHTDFSSPFLPEHGGEVE